MQGNGKSVPEPPRPALAGGDTPPGSLAPDSGKEPDGDEAREVARKLLGLTEFPPGLVAVAVVGTAAGAVGTAIGDLVARHGLATLAGIAGYALIGLGLY